MVEQLARDPKDWTKLDRLRIILDHWQDIFSPSITSTWATFTGGSSGKKSSQELHPLPRMASDQCVRKIERALTVLADCEPVLCRHLKAYRCNAEWRTTDRWVVRRLPSGKRDIVEERVREKIIPSWVRDTAVSAAELKLLKLLPGDVSIPREIYAALTK